MNVAAHMGEPVQSPLGEGLVYRRSMMLTDGVHVIELDGDGLLVVHVKDELWVTFAVLRHWGLDEKGESYYEMLFRGEGPSGSLRELRHTWWGDDGYVSYLPGEVVASALKELRRWFDVE